MAKKYNIDKEKTYVFDFSGKVLRARKTRAKAISSTLEPNCYFFSKREIKKGTHTRLFKRINKHKQ